MDKITLDYSIQNGINIGYIAELKNIPYTDYHNIGYPLVSEYNTYTPNTVTSTITTNNITYTITSTDWIATSVSTQNGTYLVDSPS